MQKILRLKDVVQVTGLGRSTIYYLIRDLQFPKPLRISARASGWLADDIETWIESKKTTRP